MFKARNLVSEMIRYSSMISAEKIKYIRGRIVTFYVQGK